MLSVSALETRYVTKVCCSSLQWILISRDWLGERKCECVMCNQIKYRASMFPLFTQVSAKYSSNLNCCQEPEIWKLRSTDRQQQNSREFGLDFYSARKTHVFSNEANIRWNETHNNKFLLQTLLKRGWKTSNPFVCMQSGYTVFCPQNNCEERKFQSFVLFHNECCVLLGLWSIFIAVSCIFSRIFLMHEICIILSNPFLPAISRPRDKSAELDLKSIQALHFKKYVAFVHRPRALLSDCKTFSCPESLKLVDNMQESPIKIHSNFK